MLLEKKLLFVLGKGGVGRTTLSTALGLHHARQGKRTLVVQWSLDDRVSPLFDQEKCGHKEKQISDNFYTMNYSPHETMQEYFVDHLKMKVFYNLIIENSHLQKLIQAAPGINELFFLGRLFWLVELAEKERGWSFDKIIVDMPAMGHAVSLFNIAPTIAKFGITGPLAVECERVSRMLADEKVTGTIVVSLPEDLPVEETIEFYPKICNELSRPPVALFVNKTLQNVSFSSHQWPEFSINPWLMELRNTLREENAFQFDTLLKGLFQRNDYQNILEKWVNELPENQKAPVTLIPDFSLTEPKLSANITVQKLSLYISKKFQ